MSHKQVHEEIVAKQVATLPEINDKRGGKIRPLAGHIDCNVREGFVGIINIACVEHMEGYVDNDGSFVVTSITPTSAGWVKVEFKKHE